MEPTPLIEAIPFRGSQQLHQHITPDFKEREKDYYQRYGIFPIMHVVVIPREIYEKFPVVATDLFSALDKSKAIGLQKMRFLSTLRYMLPWLSSDLDEISEVFGGDPWCYVSVCNLPLACRSDVFETSEGEGVSECFREI